MEHAPRRLPLSAAICAAAVGFVADRTALAAFLMGDSLQYSHDFVCGYPGNPASDRLDGGRMGRHIGDVC